jgi:antitoxin component HigA of HigAB toxin-antitoxin module
MATNITSRAYLQLIKRFPLLPIESEEHLNRATEVVEKLSDRKRTKGLVPDERGYLRVLCGLIEEYEAHYPIPPVTGAALARHLIDARGVTQLEVANATGLPASALSEVLNGKRKFSTRCVKSISPRFLLLPTSNPIPVTFIANQLLCVHRLYIY